MSASVHARAFVLHPHPALGMIAREQTCYVTDLPGGMVRVSEYAGGEFGPTMPAASLRHFVNDLEGRVELPISWHPEINAVIAGRAEFLGKGDDGMVFRVGRDVVKVSTTVPYQPFNQGHLSPAEATERLRKQAEIANLLANVSPVFQRSRFVKHGDKGFQIKPWVEIPKRLTPHELDIVQDAIIAMHKAGYLLGDEAQIGIDPATGTPVLFDVGKAERLPFNDAAKGRDSNVARDMESLGYVYQKHKRPYVRRDRDVATAQWERIVKQFAPMWRKNEANWPRAIQEIRNAAEMRRTFVFSTEKRPAVQAVRIGEINDAEEDLLMDFGVDF